MYVIDKPIAVIVDGVIGNLTRVDPHVCAQILVGVAYARIDDANHHLGRAAGDCPSIDHVNVYSSEASRLSCVAQTPKRAIL